MAIRKILIWPNDVLRCKSSEVGSSMDFKSPWIRDLIVDLFDTMHAGKGIGLAAIQVAVDERIFVMDVPGFCSRVIINPVIEELIGDPQMVEEGCLSLPGVVELTSRHPQLIATYVDEFGANRRADFFGLEAQVFAHELDHLNGKIFIDNIGPVKRNLISRKIAKTLRQRGR